MCFTCNHGLNLYVDVCISTRQCEIATVFSRFDIKALNELVVKSNVSAAFAFTLHLQYIHNSVRRFLWRKNDTLKKCSFTARYVIVIVVDVINIVISSSILINYRELDREHGFSKARLFRSSLKSHGLFFTTLPIFPVSFIGFRL